jgi:hypothetical protein
VVQLLPVLMAGDVAAFVEQLRAGSGPSQSPTTALSARKS